MQLSLFYHPSEQDKLSLLTLILLNPVCADDEPASSARNTAFDKRNDNRVYHNKLSRPRKRCSNKTPVRHRMEKHKDEASLSADEDYIVFCFREDGAFDVMKDGKSEGNPRNSRPVNRKVNRKAINSRSACFIYTREREWCKVESFDLIFPCGIEKKKAAYLWWGCRTSL